MVDRPPQPAQQRRRLVWTLAGAGLLVLVLLVIYVFWVPSWMYPSLTDSDLRDIKTAQNEPDAAKIQELKGARLKLQNDARTTLLQGLGAVLVLTGAGIGASVTLRQIRETATANRNQLQLGEQGQVTDRYIRAVEQLGHEKAPVRLGALYSLDRLAQGNLEYRQIVIDVFCAYLRMPYTLPAQTELDAEQVEEMAPPANGRDRAPHPAPGRHPAWEELQVRQTAQRLLADHLRCPPGTSGQDAQLLPPSPQQDFWPGMSLDLTGATLVDFGFARVSVMQPRFSGATFQGDAGFSGAIFGGDALFGGAIFGGDAGFSGAIFGGDTLFARAIFGGDALFVEATFGGTAGFRGATIQGDALFREATFGGAAGFDRVTFRGDAWFRKTIFGSTAVFVEATFGGNALFVEATFQGATGFGGAHVLHFDDLDRDRVWPDGWTVRPDPTDPSRGMLWSAEFATEPEPAVPPSDPTDNGSGTG